jgi:hypothetical protein
MEMMTMTMTTTNIFWPASNGDGLNVDSECLDIQFGNKQMEATSLSTTELENAIGFIHLEDNQGDIQQKPYSTERFAPQPTI